MFAKNFQSNITICVFASVSIHEITSSGSFSQSAHEGGLAYCSRCLSLLLPTVGPTEQLQTLSEIRPGSTRNWETNKWMKEQKELLLQGRCPDGFFTVFKLFCSIFFLSKTDYALGHSRSPPSCPLPPFHDGEEKDRSVWMDERGGDKWMARQCWCIWTMTSTLAQRTKHWTEKKLELAVVPYRYLSAGQKHDP